MYELFIEKNEASAEKVIDGDKVFDNLDDSLKSFFIECGGYTFRRGLYRAYTLNLSIHWSILISNYFPAYKGRILPFGYDWLGRQFCLDTRRDNYIIMLDCATAEDFELNQDLISFHNQELVEERESILDEKNFEKTINLLNLKRINYTDCIGYKKPLFIGGNDAVDNYDLTNMEVYWEMQCQIYNQVKDLPPGTKISSVKIQ